MDTIDIWIDPPTSKFPIMSIFFKQRNMKLKFQHFISERPTAHALWTLGLRLRPLVGLQLIEQRLLPPFQGRRNRPGALYYDGDRSGKYGDPGEPEQQHQVTAHFPPSRPVSCLQLLSRHGPPQRVGLRSEQRACLWGPRRHTAITHMPGVHGHLTLLQVGDNPFN